MPLAGFEPTVSEDEWLQIYALDGAATGLELMVTFMAILHNFV